ncbi:MAG: hypothetical protein WCK47_04425 [bacterium]|nr:hypothetical protein [Candidatus Sumerlaeota bacterium]
MAGAFIGYNNASYCHGELDSVEFGIFRSAFCDRGWDGLTPLRFWSDMSDWTMNNS